MADRPYNAPHQVITNGDMSQASITSQVTILQQKTLISYSYSWSGTSPVGTVAVQVSNDYVLSPDGKTVLNAGTWNALYLNYQGSGVLSIPVTGNTGNGFIDVDATAAYAIRTVYTKTSGTGTLQSFITAKVA